MFRITLTNGNVMEFDRNNIIRIDFHGNARLYEILMKTETGGVESVHVNANLVALTHEEAPTKDMLKF